MTRYLVTGANGFVGRSLTKRLIDDGNQVRAVTRSHHSLESQLNQLVITDMSETTDWISHLCDIEVVFHLAARVHVMHESAVDTLAAFQQVNVNATVRLAEQASIAGVKRFIYVSSIKVNGECSAQNHPFSELDKPNPQDAYGVSKWHAEQALQELSARTGMEIVIVRPPLIYGPGVKANMLSLIKMISKGFPLPFACIRNKRSLLYVGNLVDALLLCAVHQNAAGKTFLLSDGHAISTPDLCRYIATSLGRPIRMVKFNLAIMSFVARLIGKSAVIERPTQSLEIDSSKICNDLDWSPPYTIEQGLAVTADWFKSIE